MTSTHPNVGFPPVPPRSTSRETPATRELEARYGLRPAPAAPPLYEWTSGYAVRPRTNPWLLSLVGVVVMAATAFLGFALFADDARGARSVIADLNELVRDVRVAVAPRLEHDVAEPAIQPPTTAQVGSGSVVVLATLRAVPAEAAEQEEEAVPKPAARPRSPSRDLSSELDSLAGRVQRDISGPR